MYETYMVDGAETADDLNCVALLFGIVSSSSNNRGGSSSSSVGRKAGSSEAERQAR